jgi:hypothetical protein
MATLIYLRASRFLTLEVEMCILVDFSQMVGEVSSSWYTLGPFSIF